MMPSAGRGHVALVGAGPGDPELLTRRAERLLREADLVVYDALVNPDALALAPAARRIFVGKRAGHPPVRQAFINDVLVRNARRGLRVVRLKGGDPFVFGRGGEEGLALAAAGLPFEVVPGVSSAIAAAGLAGIPVTHRGLSCGFVVVAGHDEAAYRPVLEGLRADSATVVVMMGLAQRPHIAELLIGCGWKRSTAAAIVLDASGAEAATEVTTLGEMAVQGNEVDRRPGTIVIGAVVQLRGRLLSSRWPDTVTAAPVAPLMDSRMVARSGS